MAVALGDVSVLLCVARVEQPVCKRVQMMGQRVQLGQDILLPPPILPGDIPLLPPPIDIGMPPAPPPYYEPQTDWVAWLKNNFSPWWIIGGLGLFLVLQTKSYAPERKARRAKRERLKGEIESRKRELASTSSWL